MSTKELLLQAGEHVSEPLLTEVLDCVRFLKAQHARERWETALASKPLLRNDWD